jgi:hypothetical protein
MRVDLTYLLGGDHVSGELLDGGLGEEEDCGQHHRTVLADAIPAFAAAAVLVGLVLEGADQQRDEPARSDGR